MDTRPRSSTATWTGLGGQGVVVDRDEIWEQYRRYSFGGLIMAIVASALVRRTDRGDDMFVTMAERHARQALDLDAESLIEPPSHPSVCCHPSADVRASAASHSGAGQHSDG